MRNLARQLFHRAGSALKLVRFRMRHLLKVLMYHHFPAGTEPQFESQCVHIQRYYHPIDVDNLLAWMAGEYGHFAAKRGADHCRRRLPRLLHRALPILSRYGIPSLVFPVTDFIDGSGWLWFDRVVHAIRNTQLDRFRAPVEQKPELPLSTPQQRAESQAWFLAALMRVPQDERLTVLEQIPKLFEVEIPMKPTAEYAPMSWDEVIDAASRGVTFGGHTCSHPVRCRGSNRRKRSIGKFPKASNGWRRSFVIRSRRSPIPLAALKKSTKQPSRRSATPGFQLAFCTAAPGFVTRTSDQWGLPRIGAAPEHPILYFHQQLAGLRVGQA